MAGCYQGQVQEKSENSFLCLVGSLDTFLIILTMVITFERSRLWTIEDFVYLLTLLLYALMSGWLVLKSHSF